MHLVLRGAVIVLREYTPTGPGNPKIVQTCTLPLTGQGVVDRIITDPCVIGRAPQRELAKS